MQIALGDFTATYCEEKMELVMSINGLHLLFHAIALCCLATAFQYFEAYLHARD